MKTVYIEDYVQTMADEGYSYLFIDSAANELFPKVYRFNKDQVKALVYRVVGEKDKPLVKKIMNLAAK